MPRRATNVGLPPEAGFAGREARRGQALHDAEEGGRGETWFPPPDQSWKRR